MRTDEQTPDYVTEAMQLLEGPAAPAIPLAQDSVCVRGVVVIPIDSLDDLRAFVGRECWLRQSPRDCRWYLFLMTE